MAQYVVPDPNDTFQCPFDETHTIRALGAQKHLLKCAKSHPRAKYKVCPFNQIHYVLNADFSRHMDICPDKARFQMLMMQEQSRRSVAAEVDEFDANFTGETWDDDPDHQEVFSWNTHVSSSTKLSKQHNELPQPSSVPMILQKDVQPRRANSNFKLTPVHPTRAERQLQPKPMNGVNTNATHAATNALVLINKGRGAAAIGRGVAEKSPQQPPPRAPMQGIGRGKRLTEAPPPEVGRGSSRRMAAAIPALKATATPAFSLQSLRAPLTQKNPPQNSGSTSSSCDDNELTEADKFKQLRRLSKKLKQIEALEVQKMTGKTLNEEEIFKVNSKQELKERIRQLELEEKF